MAQPGLEAPVAQEPVGDEVVDLGLPQDKGPEHPDEVKHEDQWWKDAKIWINLVGYVAVTLALLVVKISPEIMPTVDRAFFCDDKNLKYPPKVETVHQRTLIISTVSILLMSVFISEGVYSITPEYQPQRSMDALGDVPLKDKVLLFISLVTSKLLYGYLGLVLTMNLTYYTQHMTAVLRPDFLKTCELKRSACSSGSQVLMMNSCQQKDLMDARMSFPSEYASISFYMTMFSCLIIERAISNDYFALKLAVQSSYIFWAIYVSTSRIKDHKNHSSDTIAGCLLGIFIAFLMDYLATYQDYQDIGLSYDQSQVALNMPEWEEAEQPMEDHSEVPGHAEY